MLRQHESKKKKEVTCQSKSYSSPHFTSCQLHPLTITPCSLCSSRNSHYHLNEGLFCICEWDCDVCRPVDRQLSDQGLVAWQNNDSASLGQSKAKWYLPIRTATVQPSQTSRRQDLGWSVYDKQCWKI